MQRSLFQQTDTTQIQASLEGVLPGHAASVEIEAVNDDNYHDETSTLQMALSIAGNVIGGGLLLSCMYFLPHLLAAILG